MTQNLSIGQQIVTADLRIQQLLKDVLLVGGIYTMGYDDCLVLTNDLWKHEAGGIPKHCFLLATAMEPGRAPDAAEDEEVILLRVTGPAPLPDEADLVAVRAEAMREMVTSSGTQASGTPPAILDVLTRNEIQFSALRAKVLGTFYEVDADGKPLLEFGSDIETFYSVSRYKVYKPFNESLGIVASYPEATAREIQAFRETGRQPARVRIGTIRYTSSTRRRRQADQTGRSTSVPVRVNIEDFIAMKTAVFGMTRMGKSNTMKTLATAIFQHSQETQQRVGQLLFDPAGEYANVNVQDETALAEIGRDYVTIFAFGVTEEPGVRSLSVNFFSDETIAVTWSIVTAGISHNQSGYVRSFLAADVIGPDDPDDDRSAWYRAQRRRAALYAAFLRAGFRAPRDFSVRFAAKREVVDAVNQRLANQNKDPVQSSARGTLRLTADNLESWMNALLDAKDANHLPEDWIDSEMDAILAVYRGSVGLGYKLLEPLRVFHSPAISEDYAEAVLNELIEGKVVIVDLSLGSDTVLKFISERIVNYILEHAARRFATGQEPYNLQIYLEEAHNLFHRDRFMKPAEADPYVRLAKEAAKFEIGLVYATQEVTSVGSPILANTSNWIVTHLNNRREVQELSKYYDFGEFEEVTMRAEDVGFARIKTRSGRYILPVQIDLFSADLIQAAREAAHAATVE